MLSSGASSTPHGCPLSVRRYAWTWSLIQFHAQTYQQMYPDSFHVIRFEDLVADPRAAMGTLLADMGFDWDDACLQPTFNGQPMAHGLDVLLLALGDEPRIDTSLVETWVERERLGVSGLGGVKVAHF